MKERDFQSEFGKRNKVVGVFELKFCKGTSLPFKSLADHQERALLDISSDKGLFHKITDQPFFKDPAGRMRFTRPKPFDCWNLKDVPAFVVVCFWTPRKRKTVYYIRIEDWIKARGEVGRKSLTEEAAFEYAWSIRNYLK